MAETHRQIRAEAAAIWLTAADADAASRGIALHTAVQSQRRGSSAQRIGVPPETADGASLLARTSRRAIFAAANSRPMQPIRDDSDFTVPMGPSPGELGACGAVDYSAALEFGSFANPRRVCRS